MKKIGIIDYDMGNSKSIANMLLWTGKAIPIMISSPDQLSVCDALVIPGVGAFDSAVRELNRLDLFNAIKKFSEDSKSILGICLGFQLLFEKSEEGNDYGFQFNPGIIEKFQPTPEHKELNMGWSDVYSNHQLFDGISDSRFYFVHKYFANKLCESTIASSTHGIEFCAAIHRKNIFGVQFHPEKSGENGKIFFKNFIDKYV